MHKAHALASILLVGGCYASKDGPRQTRDATPSELDSSMDASACAFGSPYSVAPVGFEGTPLAAGTTATLHYVTPTQLELTSVSPTPGITAVFVWSGPPLPFIEGALVTVVVEPSALADWNGIAGSAGRALVSDFRGFVFPPGGTPNPSPQGVTSLSRSPVGTCPGPDGPCGAESPYTFYRVVLAAGGSEVGALPRETSDELEGFVLTNLMSASAASASHGSCLVEADAREVLTLLAPP